MRFTDDGNSIYQEAFGALAYAKEPVLLTKAPPAAPSVTWGFTAAGSVDSQHTTISGGNPETVANTAVGIGAVDVTKVGIFGAKDALNVMVIGSDAFTTVDGVHTRTPGVGVAITYLNGGASLDFIFNSGFSHTDNVPFAVGGVLTTPDAVTTYSYSTDYNYRWDFANKWWFESTIGGTYSESHANGAVIGQVWTVQGGGRAGTEFVLANGVKVQPTFTGLVYSNVFESGRQYVINTFSLNPIVPGDQGQLWGKGAAKFNFVFTPNFSGYVEGNVRGTNGFVNAYGYGGQAGFRWTW
jgi:hypothetical protein